LFGAFSLSFAAVFGAFLLGLGLRSPISKGIRQN
jgi:hypothetical protein